MAFLKGFVKGEKSAPINKPKGKFFFMNKMRHKPYLMYSKTTKITNNILISEQLIAKLEKSSVTVRFQKNIISDLNTKKE